MIDFARLIHRLMLGVRFCCTF